MSHPAIAVEALAKSFHIGAPGGAGALAQNAAAPWRALRRRLQRAPAEDDPTLFWALRDVSFAVAPGEVVGVIGHNGAGKSTLLKILARITEPTRGRVRVRGRMSSLLEVGTGFHPDLSGRDNVHMNAAILGMSRSEIRQRFDAIVEFSGVERFIDTPIKHYSSGMKVRLALAVAAHLDPEILLIDEVLAVGDAAFQKKCLNRIEQVGATGRTILFVSHQLTTVARLCSRTLVVDHGRIAFDGRSVDAIRYYNERLGGARTTRRWDDPPGDAAARLHAVEVIVGAEPASGPVDVRRPVGVRLRYSVLEGGRKITPCVHLFDGSANWVFAALDLHPDWHDRPRPAGDYESTAWIPGNLLNEGGYIVSVALATLEPFRQHCFVHDCAGFTVVDPMEGDSARGRFPAEMPGMIRPILNWETRRV